MLCCSAPEFTLSRRKRNAHATERNRAGHAHTCRLKCPAHCTTVSNAHRPKHTIVVVDWGGGGIEATVVKRTDGFLSVAGQAVDASVGGGEFTSRLLAFCAKDFKRRTGGDIFENKRSVLKVTSI